MCTSDIVINVQKIHNILSAQELYTEVLIRKYMGTSGADDILSMVHRSNRCLKFDSDVIRNTLMKCSKLQFKNKLIAFNICNMTMHRYSDVMSIIRTIEEYKGNMDVAIEITEDTCIHNDETMSAISELKRNGITVILDDFGKQMSNIEAILDVDFDIIKLDARLSLESVKNNKAQEILRKTINLLDVASDKIVVEGIETYEQLNVAIECGAKYAQGYFLSLPDNLENSMVVQA